MTATWSEEGVALYVDGVLVGRRLGHGLMDLPADSELLVGSDRPAHGRVARGLIGRVDLRNGSLDEVEVARTYLEAIGDRPDRANDDRDRGGPGRGQADEHARGRSFGDADVSNSKTNPAVRHASNRRRSHGR